MKRITLVIAIIMMLIVWISTTAQPTLDPMQTVNPATGEMQFSLPLGSVQGVNGHDFPINLSYKAGIQLNQESSPVGLGFSYGAGCISRKVIFVPDNAEGGPDNYIKDKGQNVEPDGWYKVWNIIIKALLVVCSIALTFIGAGPAAIIITVMSTAVGVGWSIFGSVFFSGADFSAGGAHVPSYDYYSRNTQGSGFFKGGEDKDLPDVYFLNTPYISGQLVWIGNAENGHFVFRNMTQSHKIDYNREDETFTVILTDGTQLLFEETDRYSIGNYGHGFRNYDDKYNCLFWHYYYYKTEAMAHCWYLTRVIFPENNTTINEDFDIKFEYDIIDDHVYTLSDTNFQASQWSCGFTQKSREDNNWVNTRLCHLKKVITPNEYAVFNYSYDKKDTQWRGKDMPVLRNVTIYTKDNQPRKKIAFHTEYFLRPNTIYSMYKSSSLPKNKTCLTLRSIQISDNEANKTLPPITFDYDKKFNPEGIHLKVEHGVNLLKFRFFREEKDLWGFYCPAAVNDQLKTNLNEFGLKERVVENDILYPSAWSLKKINFPTGMSLEWVYEAGRYDRINNLPTDFPDNLLPGKDGSNKYGGIRVKKIIISDGLCGDEHEPEKCMEKWFFYTDQPGQFTEWDKGGEPGNPNSLSNSSGHVTVEPYDYVHEHDFRPEKIRGGLYTPAKLLYEMVQVVDNFQNGQAPDGYTVFQYHTPAHNGFQNDGYYGEIDNSWKAGLLWKKTAYNQYGKIVSSKENQYSFIQGPRSNPMLVANVNSQNKPYYESQSTGAVYLDKVISMLDGVTQEEEHHYKTTPQENVDIEYDDIKHVFCKTMIRAGKLFEIHDTIYEGTQTGEVEFKYSAGTASDKLDIHIYYYFYETFHDASTVGLKLTCYKTTYREEMNDIDFSTGEYTRNVKFIDREKMWEKFEGRSDKPRCTNATSENYSFSTHIDSVKEQETLHDGLVRVAMGEYDGYCCIFVLSPDAKRTVTFDRDGKPDYITVRNSDGTEKIVKTVTASAIPSADYQAMGYEKNMLIQPCQKIIYKNSPDESSAYAATTTTWAKHTSNGYSVWLPHATYAWNAACDANGKPVQSLPSFNFDNPESNDPQQWVLMNKISKYDHRNRPVEVEKPVTLTHRLYSSTIIGHRSLLPIASITNARFDECAVFTGDYDDNENNTFDNANNWVKGECFTGGLLELRDDNPHFGQRSVYVKNSYGPTKNVYIQAAKGYRFSAWVYPRSSEPIQFAVEIHIDESSGFDDCAYLYTTTKGLIENKWQLVEHEISQSQLVDFGVDGQGDYARIWIGNAPDMNAAEFYVDDIRFYPEDAYVTTTYYDQKLKMPIVSVNQNNIASMKTDFDGFGRVTQQSKLNTMVQDNITVTEGYTPIKNYEYRLMGENSVVSNQFMMSFEELRGSDFYFDARANNQSLPMDISVVSGGWYNGSLHCFKFTPSTNGEYLINDNIAADAFSQQIASLSFYYLSPFSFTAVFYPDNDTANQVRISLEPVQQWTNVTRYINGTALDPVAGTFCIYPDEGQNYIGTSLYLDDFIIAPCAAYGSGTEEKNDSLVLIELYTSTNGSQWNNNTNWLTSSPLSTWYGITAQGDTVTSIDLSHNNLSGTLPCFSGALKYLDSLSLNNNQINGMVPGTIGYLYNLQKLNINSNRFAGIEEELKNLANLSALNLGNNLLCNVSPAVAQWADLFDPDWQNSQDCHGSDSLVLAALYTNTNGASWTNNTNWMSINPISTWHGITVVNNRVTTIHLSSNGLQGTLPNEIGRLSELQELVIEYSPGLTGSIPASLGNCTKLTRLDLAGNSLTGTIPETIGNVTQLEYLFLANNQLTGTIPRSVGSLVQVVGMYLNHNDLSGEIPPEIGNCVSLQTINFQYNNLYGMIPDAITNCSQLQEIRLTENNLTHTIPDSIGKLTSLGIVEMANNQLTGTVPSSFSLCPALFTLDLSHNLFTDIGDSLVNLYNLYTLNLGNNQLCGLDAAVQSWADTYDPDWAATQICPTPRERDSLALIALYQSTNGSQWHNKTNWISVQPIDTWYGVSVTSGRVSALDLDSNNLSGFIPNLIGDLAALTHLTLSNNGLQGTFADGLTALSSLVSLDVHNNQLQDSIPEAITGILPLQYLDISVNRLYGPLPVSAGSLSNLRTLNCAVNELTGTIPASLGNCSDLNYCNVSYNKLSGIIPGALGNLTTLDTLYVHANRLENIDSGVIALTTLTQMDLQQNWICGLSSAVEQWADTYDPDWADTQYCNGCMISNFTITELYKGTSASYQELLATVQTEDGGYVSVGKVNSGTNDDALIIRFDSAGTVLWSQMVGGSGNDWLGSVTSACNGGFLCCGATASQDSGSYDAWMVWLDAYGNVLSTKTLGSESADQINAVAVTADGNILVAGNLGSDAWIFLMDISGMIMWEKVYGGVDTDYFTSVIETENGDIVTAGACWNSAVGFQGYAVRLTATGDTIWTRCYGGSNDDIFRSVTETDDFGFACAGCTNSSGAGNTDGWVVKIDAHGSVVWEHTYGAAGYDQIESIYLLYTNQLIIAGKTTSNSIGNDDGWISCLSPLGQQCWTTSIGTAAADKLNSMIINTNYHPIISGSSDANAWLLMLKE